RELAGPSRSWPSSRLLIGPPPQKLPDLRVTPARCAPQLRLVTQAQRLSVPLKLTMQIVEFPQEPASSSHSASWTLNRARPETTPRTTAISHWKLKRFFRLSHARESGL